MTTSAQGETWTILVYFAGDNNLREDMIWSLKEIEESRKAIRQAGYGEQIKVFSLFDASGPAVPIDFDTIQRRHPILMLTDEERRKKPKPVEQVRTTLRDFIDANIKEPHSDHYMLILSGHGSGAIGDFLTGDKRV